MARYYPGIGNHNRADLVGDGVKIAIPYPPSLNKYWRNIRGRTLISKPGRDYRKHLISLASLSQWGRFGNSRVSVHMTAMPPDRRRRDLDNLPKCVLDSLTHAGIWDDDSQIDDLRITRGEMVKGGKMIVNIEKMPKEFDR